MKSLKRLLTGTTLAILGLITTSSQNVYEFARPADLVSMQMATVGIGDKAPDIADARPTRNHPKIE